jgi:hypothetical protein
VDGRGARGMRGEAFMSGAARAEAAGNTPPNPVHLRVV